jgi:mannose-6-phosphate isomerase-like protein (cupin superfamily)
VKEAGTVTDQPQRIVDPEQMPVWQDKSRTQKLTRLLNDEICGAKTLSVGMYWLAPGQKTIVDVHPNSEEVYYVVQGKGTLIVDGVEGEVRGGMAVHIPAGAGHQSINTGDGDLCYFYVYAPPPKERDLSKLGWTVMDKGDESRSR